MRSFGKIWFWVLVGLIFAGGLAYVGATGRSGPVPDATKPDLVKAQQYWSVDQKIRNGLPLTEQDKNIVPEMFAARGGQREHNPLDDQGGPDSFGYAFIDNLNGDTATYNWIELRGDDQATWVNSWVQFDDECCPTPIPLGFTFPFYGNSYTTLTPTSNGQLQFGTCAPFNYYSCVPNTANPATIFAWQYDMHLQHGGDASGQNVVAYRTFGDYTVIEYDSLGFFNSTYAGSSVKFEAILFSSGRIKMQYNTSTLVGGAIMGTVGVQNDAGAISLQYRCYTDGNTVRPLDSGRAIWFALPNGIPRPVTNLQGSANGTNVTLTWTDPNQDSNGNPLTPDSILVYRGDTQPASQIGHVAHGIQSFSITESQGNLTYYLRAKAGAWLSTTASVTVVVGTPGWSSTFENDNGGLVADGGWTWGVPTNTQAPAAHGGTHMWGTGMDGNDVPNQCNHLDLSPGLVVLSPTATLEFWGWWSMYPFGQYDGVNVKVSVDEGVTWQTVTPRFPYFAQPIYSFNTCIPNEQAWSEASGGWQYVVVPIGDFEGQTPIFRFTFGNYISGYPGFFFDDMTIWGIANPPNGIPRSVTNFHGSANGNTVTLGWTDPSQDTNGNPLTPDSVLIFRGNSLPGSQIAHAAGGAQTITIANEPSGNTTYYARAKAGTYNSIAVNTSFLVGSPTYFNNFDLDNGSWVPDNGIWQWGAPTNAQGPTPHSGVNVWGTGLNGNYGNSICGQLDLNLGLEVISPTASLEFWYWYQLEQGFDGCNVKVSVDNGATWTIITPQGGYPGTTNGLWLCGGQEAAWTGSTDGTHWQYAVFPLGQYLNQTPIFRITMGSDPSVTYAGFFFDDMIIWGLHPAQSASISGTVTLNGGTGNVTQAAIVTDGLGNPNTHPAANGAYTLTGVQVGHRRILTSLTNYVTDTTSVTLDSTGQTGVNIVLRRDPPAPPSGLTGVVQTALRKDSLHWVASPDVTVDGYKVYRKLSTSPTFVYRQTVLGRNTIWVKDSVDVADGVYNYVVTAIDTNMQVPPASESVNSDTTADIFGHLPPITLTADGNFDNKIHLAWNAPNDQIQLTANYDNGINGVDGIGWWGATPSSGWFVAHYQLDGAYTVNSVRAFLTQYATVGSPIEVGVFADDGTGMPGKTPLSVLHTSVDAPLNAEHEWTLTAPVTFASGSFFVGIRQMSGHSLGLGGETITPLIGSTFFYSYDGNWSAWEPTLLSVPMLGARVSAPKNQLKAFSSSPVAVKTNLSAKMAKTTALSGKTTMAGKGSPYSTLPNESRASLLYRPWQVSQRLSNAVAPHAPRMSMMAIASRGREGRTLDDITQFVIYRDDTQIGTAPASARVYDDTPVVENQNHTYYVKARYDDNTLSAASNSVTAMCNMAPGAPTGVAVIAVGQTQMHITWTDPTVNADGSPCTDLAGIRVYRDNVLITNTPVTPGVQQYTDTPPSPTQVYTWTVKAIDEVPNEGPGASGTGSVQSPWHTVDYNWVDISTTGTQITSFPGVRPGDDGHAGPFALGFSMPFYGNNYDSIYVETNGFAAFTIGGIGDDPFFNDHIPSQTVGDPTCAVLPFWDDLYLVNSGAVYYLADAANREFIIEYLNVPQYTTGPAITMEIILDSNGGVTYQYQTIEVDVSGTVGVVNCDNTDAVELCYEDTGFWCPTDGSAVEFWGGPRQAIQGTVSHSGGTNPALVGARVWVTGGVDTILTDNAGGYRLGVDPGTYTVHFQHATHCDSVVSNVVVNANQNDTLNVRLRAPNATLSASSLTFVVRRYQTQPQTFTITNVGGTCPLSFQVLDSVQWLSSNPASDSLNPGQTVTVTVSAAPNAMQPGEYHTTIRVVCNAPGSPFLIQVDMNVLHVDEIPGGLPTEYALHANYPNPFNPTTLLPFDVPQQSQVDIIVYNVMGQEVSRPVSGKYAAGRYQVTFDAGALPSGVYLVKMKAGNFTSVGKMMLLK